MPITTTELSAWLRDYLYDRTNLYVDDDPAGLRLEGTLNPDYLAMELMSVIDPCPCDCEDAEFVGRWTSGSFTEPGPLRSAYTCAEHRELVAAWCHVGTGLPPVWTATPGPRPWRSMEKEATK